ncbi:type II toxin-antitoxin system VapC family toxin [Niabella soli]|uniref:Twitching motility protein PilT n=1 Tax=Niabella soli DSM 19437 TaxID=929713 RepID=W0EV27_9BACT|nr:PIN domain-containing protein [Niabella soli]AHF14627.1 twitching motility protein PilT [Niabella soli DSM 19437]
MKIFIDANILVAVVNKEYPLYTYAARVLSWATAQRYQLVTTSVCFAITFYFAEKKHGNKIAKERIALLANHFIIADCGSEEVQQAAADKSINDFEDGLQYFAAVRAGCSCIVTENVSDFYFSTIEVLTAIGFLKSYYPMGKRLK